jgi:hypothetical protein
MTFISREDDSRVVLREVPINSLSLAYIPNPSSELAKAFQRRYSNIETSKQL